MTETAGEAERATDHGQVGRLIRGRNSNGRSDSNRSRRLLVALPAADEEKVGWDGAAPQVFGGVPGGAVRVVDGDEVNPAERAYVMHPDVGVAQAGAAGLASQFKGFGDVSRWLVGGKDACFRRDAVDGDLDALYCRRGEVVEHEVKTLCGTGLSGVAGAHDLPGCLTAGGEAYGAS